MKKLLIGAVALSVMASAGMASAQPYRGAYDGRGDRYEQRYDRDRGEQRGARYNAGRYQPPRGYQTRHFRRGERLPAAYRSRGYVVDHRRYGLRAPPRGYQYVRVDNDVVMTAIATGVIASVITSLFQ